MSDDLHLTGEGSEQASRARVLSYFFISGGVLGLFTLAFLPLPADTDEMGELVTLLAGLGTGAALYLGGARVPRWAVPVVLAGGTVAVSFGVYFAGTLQVNTEMFYLWVAFYGFYFLGRRAAAAQLVWIGAAYAAVLAVRHEPGPASTRWAITMGTLAVAGLLVAHLVGRLRSRAAESARRMHDLHTAEERFRLAFEDAAIGMALVTLDGRWLRVNRALARLTGYPQEHLNGLAFREITHHEDRGADDAALEEMLSGDRPGFETEKRYIHADGHVVWVQLNVTVVREDDGRPLHLISQMQDVTERKRAQAELAHQALHDPLTGLPNRLLFLDRLEVALARLSRRGSAVGVLFLDLDRFKLINDTYGHDAGDRVLVEVAARLKGLLRPSDTLSRFGGDEFIILCEDVESEPGAVVVAERIEQVLAPPFSVGDREAFISASIGIALGRDAGFDPGALLRDADAAMYSAKDRGRSRYAVFDGDMRLRGAERLEIETALRRALERDELRIFYQPEVDLETGRVVGVEALLRWQHPERGLVGPGEFIPVAEETGLIVPIGEWVLRRACLQARAWREAFADELPLRMAVNLSARQLARGDLSVTVGTALADAAMDPGALCLEITESAISEDPPAAVLTLRALTALGVCLAIDDFGVGFSSLSQIRHLPPVDVLKIDRSFVAGLGENREDTAIVTSVISLAHSLGLTAIAEGVETAAHVHELRALGCDLAQGFHFARPAPAETITELLRTASLGELLA
ncbi:MAG: EAL domain-containing protein [Actinomycetota bacterium]|nr:EAL domain-containing protein [Actinomycetota bacterium]